MCARARRKPLAACLITYLVPFPSPPGWGALGVAAGGVSGFKSAHPTTLPSHLAQRHVKAVGVGTHPGVGVPTPASARVSSDKRPAAGGG